MDFTKNDLSVFRAFLDQRPEQGKRFSTDGKRLNGGMYLSRVATWEQGERGAFIETHDLGSRNAQQIHRKLRKMGGGIVHEAGGHRVADFDMLNDLIAHAGATHLAVDKDNIANRLYIPKGKGYLELRIWQKEGFWHAQAPDRGKLINQLPRDSSPIINRPSKAKTLWKRVVGAPRGRVEDYEAIDRRDRVIAGPFKHYSDAKDAAGSAGAVRFVPSRGKKTTEASRGSAAHRRTANGAEARGAEYARDQLQGDYFMDWVREQLLEASKMPPSDVLPLEDKHDARIIARNMLQQLEWDTRRELQEDDAFWKGFREALNGSRDWLADELLEIKGGIGGSVVGEGDPYGVEPVPPEARALAVKFAVGRYRSYRDERLGPKKAYQKTWTDVQRASYGTRS